MENNNEILLSVRHLKQYFKLGNSKLKAIHDISFDVKKGEVFGLVGESGCGKTTTGRSIIKLYDITSGNIIFKGQRICAGTRWNEKEIKFTKIRGERKIKEYKTSLDYEIRNLRIEEKDELENKLSEYPNDPAMHKEVSDANAEYYNEKVKEVVSKYTKLIDDEQKHIQDVVSTQTAKIKSARYEHKHCNELYREKLISELNKEYAEKIKLLEDRLNDSNNDDIEIKKVKDDIQKIKKEFHEKISEAKSTNLMTKMQMIFQDPIASLNPRMTVREIIAEGLIIKGIKDKKYIDEKVYEVLKLVGLVPEHASRYPHEFSGGQRQRIGIARALIMEPELIIADEPISALDVSIQAQVINLLNELREKMGLTILFIAHDLSVVKYFSDRIAVMYFGKIVELTTSDELFAHPLHPYTKSLLSAIPLPDPHYEKQRKRIVYNPAIEHDYSIDKPSLREISPGHFVYCNEVEYNKYVNELNGIIGG